MLDKFVKYYYIVLPIVDDVPGIIKHGNECMAALAAQDKTLRGDSVRVSSYMCQAGKSYVLKIYAPHV